MIRTLIHGRKRQVGFTVRSSKWSASLP
jgi:hypothetical protein